MKTILVMCTGDPSSDPRPLRMINCLNGAFKIVVAAKENPDIAGVDFERITQSNKMDMHQKVIYATRLKLRRFEDIVWSKEMKQLGDRLLSLTFDLIIVQDIILLPIALRVKNKARVIFDAREYYPREQEDQLSWRFFFQDFNKYLCSTYLRKCDYMITVSYGLASEYLREYGVKSEVIMSLPLYHECTPSLVDSEKIRIIHHGYADVSRRIETMIQMMDYIDVRFSLDLMLIPGEPGYFKKIVKEADKRPNVTILPPVKFGEIIPFTNKYDIGLFLVPPTTFNLKYCLPNKLFEFIQARLAVSIGPSIEMSKIVKKYDCGIVASDFEPKTLATELNKLTPDRIMYYKERSNYASKELNYQDNCKRLKKIINELSEQG